MGNEPLVSVVIPTHQRPEFLKKTLQSILSQTYPHLEIFVISNGINKKNKEIVDYFNDNRVTYKEQENSGGPSSPRNHGIRLALGKYIAFCDDDDLWIPEKIEKQVQVLEENPEYGLCYSKMLRFDEVKEWSNANEEGVANFKSLLFINTIPISSVIMRRQLIVQSGQFSESSMVGTSEDYEFLLRQAVNTKFYFLDEYLIKYWSGINRTTSFSFNNSIYSVFLYTMKIFLCYFLVYRQGKTKISCFFSPIIFHSKNLFKSVGHILLVRTGLKRDPSESV